MEKCGEHKTLNLLKEGKMWEHKTLKLLRSDNEEEEEQGAREQGTAKSSR